MRRCRKCQWQKLKPHGQQRPLYIQEMWSGVEYRAAENTSHTAGRRPRNKEPHSATEPVKIHRPVQRVWGSRSGTVTGQPEQLERLPVSGTQSSLINAESGKDLWLRTLWPETQRSTAHSRLPQPGDHLVTVQTENFCLGQMIRQVGRQECRCNSRQTRT